MVTLLIGKHNPDIIWDKEEKVFCGSENDIKFSTDYLVKNVEKGTEKLFSFTHSTGPEFAPDTAYVYKTKEEKPEDVLELWVYNDPTVTATRAKMYLEAKTRRK